MIVIRDFCHISLIAASAENATVDSIICRLTDVQTNVTEKPSTVYKA